MAPLETPLCSVLDVRHPIVQAPVGSVSTPELAAAVADAGGLGMLAMSWRERAAIERTFDRASSATDGVVGVNVVLDESTGVLPPGECLEACLDAGADVVSVSFGDAEGVVDRIHEADALAMVSVGSAAAAERAEAAGADVIVAQGWEAGGHVQSEVASMSLLPAVADAVSVPVVAAGGIADGRGIAAALALGADGAWLGTRFVATEEAGSDDRYRADIVSAEAADTVLTDLFYGGWPDQPHRVLENETVDAWQAAGEPDPGDRPGEGEVVARTPDGDAVERYADLPPTAGAEGDPAEMAEYAGQSAGATTAVRPAGAVVTNLVGEAAATIEETAGLVVR